MSRPDVEQYIEFNWDNIIETEKFNFKPWAYALVNQGPYDYASFMHYDQYAVEPLVNSELLFSLVRV